MEGLNQELKHFFFLLSTCTEELTSTQKIIAFLPNKLATEKVPHLSGPIPYPKYLHLSISAFFTNLTALNKELSNLG